tara:strand:- start:1032 stop:1451 length:420 start_codon:yes stop_codon:yes gene_type:complete
MASRYTNEDLEKLAIKAIQKHKLFFIQDIVSYLPIGSSQFYNRNLEKSESIKEAMMKERTEIKVAMRYKWYKSDNPTLQMGLMKLISTDEERIKLSQTFKDVTTQGEKITDEIDYTKLSKATLLELAEASTKTNIEIED